MKANQKSELHTVAEPIRRKLAESFRKRAAGKQDTEAERAEFARMAESWERTLPKKR